MRGDSEAQAASPEARPPSPCLGRPAVAVHEKEIVSVEGAHTLHTYTINCPLHKFVFIIKDWIKFLNFIEMKTIVYHGNSSK